jgi:ribosomal protein L7/L12
MNQLHTLTEGDVDEVGRNISQIMHAADAMAAAGVSQAFEVYKLARNALEILAFDRISRDALAKLGQGHEMFQGYRVTDTVKNYMLASQKINAIKEFRTESGLGLKEAKDWVEAYIQHHNIRPW